jgi:sulfite reductase (ferredoxin)
VGDTYTYGLPVASGRVADRDDVNLRSAIRELAGSGLVAMLHVTPRQDLLFSGIAAEDRTEVEAVLVSHGVTVAASLTPLTRLAIACPALPTCGQALGEAERVLPDLVGSLDSELTSAGLTSDAIHLNMTGCPNGCARPYTAEVGIVGRTKTTYDVYVGGAAGGDRLAQRLRADVPLSEVPAVLSPLFRCYAEQRQLGEAFGDFCARAGIGALETLLPAPTVRRRAARAGADR